MEPDVTSPRATAGETSASSPSRSSTLDHVTVCVCTYKRQEGLGRLLEAIGKQQTGGRFTYSVVVVDNDRAESARAAVQSFAAASKQPVNYFCEPRQNISLARNRCRR